MCLKKTSSHLKKITFSNTINKQKLITTDTLIICDPLRETLRILVNQTVYGEILVEINQREDDDDDDDDDTK